MKKVVLILLSVALLLVSCAKQTTVTTEQTDLTKEPIGGTVDNITEPSGDVTDPSETPTEPEIRIIGEYATVEEAFAGYELKGDYDYYAFKTEQSGTDHAYKIDSGRFGFMMKREEGTIGIECIRQVYAFGKLYDITDFAFPGILVNKCCTKCEGIFVYSENILAIVGMTDVLLICEDGVELLRGDDTFSYSAYTENGDVCYEKYVVALQGMQVFRDWVETCWYTGYGDEKALEYGTVSVVHGEILLTVNETQTVSEWLIRHPFIGTSIKQSGFETPEEYIEAYLRGELE